MVKVLPWAKAKAQILQRRVGHPRREGPFKAAEAKLFQRLQLNLLASQRSFLEAIGIDERTAKDYGARVVKFISLCESRRWDWSSTAELDIVLVSVFDEMFYKLEEASAAYKLLSGIKYFLPHLKGPDSLPRALHAAKVYSLRRPANQRLPLPWVATCAIVARMCSRNHVAMGVETILSHKC